LSTLAGIALDFANVKPVRALFLSAVLNGLLAPFLLLAIVIVAADVRLMQGQPSSRLSRVVVLASALLMVLAAAACFYCDGLQLTCRNSPVRGRSHAAVAELLAIFDRAAQMRGQFPRNVSNSTSSSGIRRDLDRERSWHYCDRGYCIAARVRLHTVATAEGIEQGAAHRAAKRLHGVRGDSGKLHSRGAQCALILKPGVTL
jgi:hypothetical protein